MLSRLCDGYGKVRLRRTCAAQRANRHYRHEAAAYSAAGKVRKMFQLYKQTETVLNRHDLTPCFLAGCAGMRPQSMERVRKASNSHARRRSEHGGRACGRTRLAASQVSD